MAIIAHYVTNNGQLGAFLLSQSITHLHPLTEELLINFHELIGEHSGENMAEAVWAMMELYCLIGKVSFQAGSLLHLLTHSQVIAIAMDNASNNNMLMTPLERQCQQQGVIFSAQDARMQCMPHTIHLAAIKVSFSVIVSYLLSTCSLFSFWKESEPCRRLKARRPSRAVGTIKTTLQYLYCANMITMEWLMLTSMKTRQNWATCYPQSKGLVKLHSQFT